MNTTTIRSLAGIGLVAALGLSACSSGGEDVAPSGGGDQGAEDNNSVVYEFTGETVSGEEEIRFEVPEQLIELDEQVSEDNGIDSYIDTRAITAVTARAAEGQQCVIELEYEFDEGAVAEIEENEWLEPDDSEVDIDMRYAIAAGAGARSQPDGTIMRSGTEQRSQTEYLIDLDCASAPNDDASTFDVQFNKMRDSKFIYAEVAIMSDGTLSIVDEGTLSDWTEERDLYVLDSSGTWIENPDTPEELGNDDSQNEGPAEGWEDANTMGDDE